VLEEEVEDGVLLTLAFELEEDVVAALATVAALVVLEELELAVTVVVMLPERVELDEVFASGPVGSGGCVS
jgi:hypothetical protein